MRNKWIIACAASLALWSASGSAREFSFDLFGEDINAILNNTLTAGAQWRLHDRADYLVGKSNLNPDVCAGTYQLCQGVIRDQSYPAAHLRDAPGQASMNFDNGNLNYDKGDIVQAPIVLNTDVKFGFGDMELFVRGRGLYDPVNYDFVETYPNKTTPDNYDQVATRGDPYGNRYYGDVLTSGTLVREKRPDNIADEYLFYELLDLHLTVPFTLMDRDVLLRVGKQVVNWGESTAAIVNSLSQANPVNANNIYRLGNALLEDLFIPVNMANVFVNLTSSLSLQAHYAFEWRPVEIPAPGTFYSFLDAGTNNLGPDRLNASFGQATDDLDQMGTRISNPFGLVSMTTLSVGRLRDDEARDGGEYGISLKYFSDLNYGTEFGFYFMNYHSKLPYVDGYSTNASCMRAAGNPEGRNANNTFDILTLCPNLNLVANGYPGAPLQAVTDLAGILSARPEVLNTLGIDGTPLDAVTGVLNLLVPQPGKPDSEIIPLDTANVQLTYPEDLKMFGLSFNTTYGDYSFQGEVAYRPNLPLQVSLVDVLFAAMQPTLGHCNDPSDGCDGTVAAVGYDENSPGVPGGNGQNTTGQYYVYDTGDATDANGNPYFNDTAFLLLAGVPSPARAFPSFLVPYRGGSLGDEPGPNQRIRGWEEFDVLQYNLGATRLYSRSDWPSKLIGADQVLFIYEVAATHVLNMPDFDELQIEGPLTAYTHASAGADGSGADGSRQACSTNIACTIGPDGIRFNPWQAPRDAFADAFSWGYKVVGRILYESVLPSISISPLFLWQHDIHGNSPAPHFNFVEGRYSLTTVVEVRYEKALSFNVAYNLYGGAGHNNLMADRDNLGFYIKYQF
ncbi:DUF1302 family protein [Algiphilus sp. W345]|uniref:DUF1302 family protein n=1 Tax=Banduia mediterranea TaxID=3075609 RepID=A0ABU2WFZ8_9GAMM|nr:DUF1302 family protein [Algiphilus sp. W345]MDT0496209.1 DUF1302 family protein [Algiphilus sp. W345]